MNAEKDPVPPGKKHFRGKPALILAAGVILFFLWIEFWHDGPEYWSVFFSVLPPFLFFPVEEFLAIAGHNSPWSLIGGGLIAGGFLIWAIRVNGKKLRIWEGALLGLIAVLLLLFLMPCLCAPKEKIQRILCIADMKEAWSKLYEKYPDKLPEELPEEMEALLRNRHAIRYCGAGRNWKEPRFILFEDEDRSHAGDLRHRLWSDGKVESRYPWKEGKK